MRATGRKFQKAALGVAFFAFLLILLPLGPQAAPAQDQALIAAADRGDGAAVQRLLREGASLDARDARGRTALLAATHGNRIEAARVFSSPPAPTSTPKTPSGIARSFMPARKAATKS